MYPLAQPQETVTVPTGVKCLTFQVENKKLQGWIIFLNLCTQTAFLIKQPKTSALM